MELIKDDSLLNHNLELEAGEFCIKRTNRKGQPTKLSDVFNRIPYGYIIKSETGMGATTLELMSERNSIIVEPLRITASSKAAHHKGSLYVGSETRLHLKPRDKAIKAYHNSRTNGNNQAPLGIVWPDCSHFYIIHRALSNFCQYFVSGSLLLSVH